jgi:predicted NUDIX family NTP pyrophosphohydrolase
MKESAGILLYRRANGRLEVLLVHPGGPFWRSKDAGAWSIPKGEIGAGEDPLACARRELKEEIGFDYAGPATPLPLVTQKGGKLVRAWAAEADFDPASLVSNTFEMEWPPKSGKRASFPEVDRAEWFDLEAARAKINAAQAALLDGLADRG